MRRFLYSIPLFLMSNLLTAPLESIRFPFSGSLNVGTVCSEVDDGDACDSSNMINDVQGAIFKRNGSRRYNSIPASSQPITSLFRAYASTGGAIYKALLMTSGNRIYYSTGGLNTPFIAVSSNLVSSNQRWSWVMFGNR